MKLSPSVTIVFFCHDGCGHVLLAKRSQQCRDEQGKWDIGGGQLEFGETVGYRLKQEIKEEYTTKILDYEFLGFRDIHRTVKGQKSHWLALDYKVLVDRSLVTNGELHKFDQIGWFTLKNLPTPLHSQLPKFLKKYRANLQIEG